MRTRLSDEQGFTLIELLVVILIIGILAAIALPNFIGQRGRAQDSSAKTNARNAVSMVEACYTDTQTYATCKDTSGLGTNTGLNFVAAAPAPGTSDGTEVLVAPNTASGYKITGYSKSGNSFSISKDPTTGAITRDCGTAKNAGCPTGGKW